MATHSLTDRDESGVYYSVRELWPKLTSYACGECGGVLGEPRPERAHYRGIEGGA